MRIYEGSPRQDFEEVFRSIGAFIDSHGMRDILLVEVPDGFIVQGLTSAGVSTGSAWSESVGTILLLVCSALGVIALERRSLGYAIAAGLACSVMTLCRSVMALYPVVLAASFLATVKIVLTFIKVRSFVNGT